DGIAIDRILALDAEGLHETVRKERISMCGCLPVATMLFAAKALGAQSARLVKYTTSAEVSGDYDHVVGYAGIVLR
ncbi:MAG: AmmeMemoRadiSam system protein B, partial [Nitrospirota bacterium]